MNTYILKNLAKNIVSQGLKKSEALKLTSLLSPKDLRLLSQILITEQEKMTARVITSDELSQKDKSAINSALGGKQMVATTDKKIGAGLKIQLYDMIYDLTIKSSIERVTRELEEQI